MDRLTELLTYLLEQKNNADFSHEEIRKAEEGLLLRQIEQILQEDLPEDGERLERIKKALRGWEKK